MGQWLRVLSIGPKIRPKIICKYVLVATDRRYEPGLHKLEQPNSTKPFCSRRCRLPFSVDASADQAFEVRLLALFGLYLLVRFVNFLDFQESFVLIRSANPCRRFRGFRLFYILAKLLRILKRGFEKQVKRNRKDRLSEIRICKFRNDKRMDIWFEKFPQTFSYWFYRWILFFFVKCSRFRCLGGCSSSVFCAF